MTRQPLDLRLAPCALGGWGAAAVGQGWGTGPAVATGVLLIGLGLLAVGLDGRRRSATGRVVAGPADRADATRGVVAAEAVEADLGNGAGADSRRHASTPRLLMVAAVLVVAGGAFAVAGLHGGAVAAGPIPELARERATVQVEGRVASDPIARNGTFGSYVVVRMLVDVVTGRGQRSDVRTPILVVGDPAWLDVRFGESVRTSGQLEAADSADLAGVLIARRTPELLDSASWVDRAVSRVRGGITAAAEPLGETERALVPALVNGDDSAMPADAIEEFRATGLTHLLAVSGANVTLVLAFVLVGARWCGIRGRWLPVVAVVTVVFFVLVARPQPSVLRAAAMGVVGIVGMSAGGRARGIRALSVAVLTLVLVDPWLARSVGFLLSVLATGGIVLLVPVWREAMARWMPAPAAEALAIPLAAQLVCTPVVAAISGQVSLVAVLANLLAAPAVGPTTVLGLIGGLVAVGVPEIGQVVGRLAGVFAWWIVAVARNGADLDGAAIGWPTSTWAILALTMLCGLQLLMLTRMLPHRWPSLAVAGALIAVVVHPLDRPGWPPGDWVMVMCDVGQGDGLVLNAGGGVVVVVDAGPDPDLMDRCLDRLEVHEVALVVLTHFHADHVDGLPGVLRDRQVAEIHVSPLDQPAGRAGVVHDLASAARIPVTVGAPGDRWSIGELELLTIGPVDVDPYAGDDGTEPNNASLVMLAEHGAHEILLAGDSEPEEQADILATKVDLDVDVLKVAHHGSAQQDADFVTGTQAPLALISAGADNDYGHPSGHLLGLLRQAGSQVYRTDTDGDIAVVGRAGGLAVVTWK